MNLIYEHTTAHILIHDAVVYLSNYIYTYEFYIKLLHGYVKKCICSYLSSYGDTCSHILSNARKLLKYGGKKLKPLCLGIFVLLK